MGRNRCGLAKNFRIGLNDDISTHITAFWDWDVGDFGWDQWILVGFSFPRRHACEPLDRWFLLASPLERPFLPCLDAICGNLGILEHTFIINGDFLWDLSPDWVTTAFIPSRSFTSAMGARADHISGQQYRPFTATFREAFLA